MGDGVATVATGEMALLEWTARDDDGLRVAGGVDPFVIRDDRIQGRTIRCTVVPAPRHGSAASGG